jgi:hypothetical protein
VKYRAFVSYSRHDKLLVQPLVLLMEVGKQHVFWDQDSISPGDDWRLALAQGIASSEALVVFWCCHAGRSEWVTHEVEEAARHGKPIVPFLLCGQRLPDMLARFQWIDCRQGARHACLVGHEPAPSPAANTEIGERARQALAPSASARGLLLAAFSGAALVTTVAVLVVTPAAQIAPLPQGYGGSADLRSGETGSAGLHSGEPHPGLETPTPLPPAPSFTAPLLVVLGVVTTLVILLAMRRRRTRHLRQVTGLPDASRDLAEKLLGVMALQKRGKLQH